MCCTLLCPRCLRAVLRNKFFPCTVYPLFPSFPLLDLKSHPLHTRSISNTPSLADDSSALSKAGERGGGEEERELDANFSGGGFKAPARGRTGRKGPSEVGVGVDMGKIEREGNPCLTCDRPKQGYCREVQNFSGPVVADPLSVSPLSFFPLGVQRHTYRRQFKL